MSHCLSFFYFMRNNQGKGRLSVYVSEEPNQLGAPLMRKSLLWSIQGDQRDRTRGDELNWFNGQVNVQFDGSHQIIFEGLRGHGFYVSNFTIWKSLFFFLANSSFTFVLIHSSRSWHSTTLRYAKAIVTISTCSRATSNKTRVVLFQKVSILPGLGQTLPPI